ncbi:MAG: hypothetical protein AAFV53_15510 [Myxococcota bacterium]
MILGLLVSLALNSPASAAEVATPSKGHASNPSWSQDGQWLAFELNNYGGKIDLYMVQVANGNALGTPEKLSIPGNQSSFSSGGSVAAAPNWHPRGVLIFEGTNSSNSSRIYSRAPKGGAPSSLIKFNQVDGDLSWPAISPDGKTIAFISDATGSGDLYLWDFNTNAITQAVSSPFAEMAPRFHANGEKLAYTRKNRGGQDLFTWEGGSSTPLVGGNGDQTRPVWAGDQVVFFTNERGENQWDIAVSSGPGQKQIIARGVRLPQRSTPALTPDAQWVVYGVEDTTASMKIMMTRIDGSKTVEVDTGLVACGEPSLVDADGRTYMAFTALPSEGADWRKLHIIDITNQLN